MMRCALTSATLSHFTVKLRPHFRMANGTLLLLVIPWLVQCQMTSLNANDALKVSSSNDNKNEFAWNSAPHRIMAPDVTPAQPFSLLTSTSIVQKVTHSALRHLTSLDYPDYDSESSKDSWGVDLNSSTMNRKHLEELRHQIEVFSNEAYRSERIMYSFAYGIIVILSFFGNLLVVKVCMANKTITNALLLSMALSDITMVIFTIPFNYFRLLNYSWPFGSSMCFIVNFVQHLVVYVSSYTCLAIAIQRFCSVNSVQFEPRTKRKLCSCFPSGRLCASKGTQIYSMRPIFISIAITWLFAGFISVLFTYSSTIVAKKDIVWWIIHHSNLATGNSTLNSSSDDDLAFETDSSEHVMLRCQNPLPVSVNQFFENLSINPNLTKSIIIFISQYFFPLSISCVLYIRIGKIITRQGKLATVRGNPKARIRQKKKRRRIIMLCLVVAAFGISWLPIHVFHILTDAGIFEYNYQIFMVVHWLAMSSVSYNPFIYMWLNKSFRKAALRVFCCCVNEEAHFKNINGTPHSRSTSRGKLLNKVPCCSRRSASKNTVNESQQPLNLTSNQQPTKNALGPQSLLTSVSAQSNMSVGPENVTETSMVAFTSIGSIERLTEIIPPRKSKRFNLFRRNKANQCSLTTNMTEVCQINIEECDSDKGDLSYDLPENNIPPANSLNMAFIQNVHQFQLNENETDSDDEEPDDCLLNEHENKSGCQRDINRSLIELAPVTPSKVDVHQDGDSCSRVKGQCNVSGRNSVVQFSLDNLTARTNGSFLAKSNQQTQLVLTTDL